MSNNLITVTGTAIESAPPDTAEISVTVASKSKDYSETVTAGTEKVKTVISALEKKGFLKQDIKTSNFNISAEYDNVQTDNGRWERQFSGYKLTHRLHLSFPFDMDKLNDAVNAVVSCKTADPEINISFSVKDKEEINRRLLTAAVKDARNKAEIIASAAGVKLGELCGITYGAPVINTVSPTMYKMANEAEHLRGISMDTGINPEDAENSIEVTASWRAIDEQLTM